MNVDALTVAGICKELQTAILGGRVERIILAGELALGFELYAGGRRRWLYASCHPQGARIHLAGERLVRPSDDVSPLLLLLRKYVKDGRLVSIEQPSLERVLILGFEKRDEAEVLASRLVVELMGRYSNLVLVDANGDVLDSAKRVTSAMNRVRVTLPRHPYVPPPPQDRADPVNVTGGSLRLLLTMHASETLAWRALIVSYRAVSPLVAREIVFRATGSTETSVGDIADWDALAAAQANLFADALAGRWEPSVAEDQPAAPSEEGGDEDSTPPRIAAFAPYRLTQRPSRRIESISAAVEQYFAQSTGAVASGLEPMKNRARAVLADRMARVQARIDALDRQMAQVAETDRLRAWGEYVLGFAHEVRSGQSELVVDGLRIPLDPGKSAVENAQAYFREYHKAKGAAIEVPRRLDEANIELAYLREVATQIDLAERREEVAAIERDLSPAAKDQNVRLKRRTPRLPLRTERTPDGFEIIVGMTSAQNDEITFKVARPEDLWLHARGVPGAHVVVRTGGHQITESVLQRAAACAARHSQSRSAAQVAVDYTLRRYVRRISGAPPGLVSYTHEQTIHVSPTARE